MHLIWGGRDAELSAWVACSHRAVVAGAAGRGPGCVHARRLHGGCMQSSPPCIAHPVVRLQTSSGTDMRLYTVYVPTNHVYVGDIFLLSVGAAQRPCSPRLPHRVCVWGHIVGSHVRLAGQRKGTAAQLIVRLLAAVYCRLLPCCPCTLRVHAAMRLVPHCVRACTSAWLASALSRTGACVCAPLDARVCAPLHACMRARP